jgi:hypothetical protein
MIPFLLQYFKTKIYAGKQTICVGKKTRVRGIDAWFVVSTYKRRL